MARKIVRKRNIRTSFLPTQYFYDAPPPIFQPKPEPQYLTLTQPHPTIDTHFETVEIQELSTESLLLSVHLPTNALSLPPLPPTSLFTDLPTDLILPPLKFECASKTYTPLKESFDHLLLSQLPLNPTVLSSAATTTISKAIHPIESIKAFNSTTLNIKSPSLPQLPTLEDLDTANLSDSFESELVFLPKEDEEGYIFALTLIPRADLQLPALQQHITFLIDRSNSVQKERLQATKQSVLKSLDELSANDNFNIIVFDNKQEKLFQQNMPICTQNIELADQFLNNIQLGSFFSFADLYSPLLQTMPSSVRDEDLHSVILITDGESLAKKNVQRSLLNYWTVQNQGKVSLYTVSMDDDRHQATLDALSMFNKGSLTSSSTNRGLKRKLLKLIRNIGMPIAKNISITAVPTVTENHIELYPKTEIAPHLFRDQPYIILGKTQTLDDFVLFVQGRLKNKWLNIKKKVSFVHAKRGGHSLKMQWALHKAYEKYERYAVDENPQHLSDAQAILEPYELKAAFR